MGEMMEKKGIKAIGITMLGYSIWLLTKINYSDLVSKWFLSPTREPLSLIALLYSLLYLVSATVYSISAIGVLKDKSWAKITAAIFSGITSIFIISSIIGIGWLSITGTLSAGLMFIPLSILCPFLPSLLFLIIFTYPNIKKWLKLKKNIAISVCILLLISSGVIFIRSRMVIYQYSNSEEITLKISPKKVHFRLLIWNDDKNPIRIGKDLMVHMITGTTDYFDGGPFSTRISVWDAKRFLTNEDYIANELYYNTVDNGIYTSRVKGGIEGEIFYNGKPRSYNAIYKYYRIGKGEIINGKFKPTFIKGTWFSYRKKAFFSWGKDSNRLKIHVKGIKGKKPDFISYSIVAEDGGGAKEAMP